MAKVTQKQMEDLLDQIMDQYVDRVFAISQENLVTKHTKRFKSGNTKNITTTDTGELLQSGNIQRERLRKTITYTAPYAEDVEYGNNGNPVTPDELMPWIKRKALPNSTPYEQKRAARNIARALAKRGQTQDPFLRTAIAQAETEVTQA